MKEFLSRNALALTILLALAVTGCAYLYFQLHQARTLQEQTLKRIDMPVVSPDKLPGMSGNISDRSKQQLDTIFGSTPHVLGGFVTRITYSATEDPIIYIWPGSSSAVKQFVTTYHDLQTTPGKGVSSAQLSDAQHLSLRNSEEAKNGLIKCGTLDETNLPTITPSIRQHAQGVCRATIPPFDPNVNLAIVVVIDIDGTTNTKEVQALRRSLLQLQIDIFNRDYQGRETWAAPL